MTDAEQRLLDDLLEVESGLSAWEMDFLDNMDTACRERKLTERQADKLHDIARKMGVEE